MNNRESKKSIPLTRRRPENNSLQVSYQSAHIIGIFYESARGEEIQEVNQLIKTLTDDGKEVYSLKFIMQPVSKESMSEIGVNTLKRYTLSKKDVNLLRKIKKKSVKGLLDEYFDVIVYLSLKDLPPLHKLVGACQSIVKAAPYNEKFLKYYNLMLNSEKERNMQNLTDLFMKYFKMLNNTGI